MKQHLQWAINHILIWATLYMAFGINVEGARHILTFYIWTIFPFSFGLLLNQTIEQASKIKPPPLLRVILSRIQQWTVLGCLIWFDFTATAVAWAIILTFTAYYRLHTEQLRAAATDKE